MEIISHRGNGFEYPENSGPAFSNALKRGISVELDIRLSKDNVPFVSHNADIDEILKGKGKISDFNSNEIDKFNYKINNGLKLVKFKEVLRILDSLESGSNIFVHVQDINEEGIVERVLELIDEPKYKERVFLFAVDEMSLPLIDNVRELDSDINVGLHLPENSKYFNDEFFKKADFIWADEIKGEWLSKDMVILAHKLGKKIYAISPELILDSVYSKDYKKRWKDIVEFGFDGICTDFPLKIRKNSEKSIL